ncbi:MAG: glycine--tRNA ligase subunit beta [Azoarcus sp.]|jgi:glycyl-tRNA synthetase beta chain|nr:glycine--tRNA ligase subunit beta [Azoarcus sp.]
MTHNLLVEILAEELPPKALNALGDSFAQSLAAALKRDALAADDAVVTAYATPRRLAAHITDVRAQAADRAVSQKLMPVSVGLDTNGAPTPALLKKLASLGVDAPAISQLRREGEGKAETLFLESVAQGATLAEGLQRALESALAALPIPKVMSYQLADGWTSVSFARPAHGLLALHGAAVVPISVLGLSSGNTTRGHRFEAPCDPIVIEHADRYAETLLEKGAVIASFAERRAEIARQLMEAAKRTGVEVAQVDDWFRPIDDAALLDEVTALVERPNVLVGQFDSAFLDVPQECLILTMKANQKYFPLVDSDGNLARHFLMVSNLSPDDPSAIIGGNERVVRPRLADAQFFFEQDKKKTLESRLPGLDKVVYHNKLGSQGDRSKRVAAIAASMTGGFSDLTHAETEAIEQAARLAKTDLLTDMVGEFPELQGTMGRYYALNEGFSEEVADAIEDHYKPRFAGDVLPRSRVGKVVALADKLETLAGMFGIGQTPTGDKDPFALRRHALGIIRILMEGNLGLSLDRVLISANLFGASGLDMTYQCFDIERVDSAWRLWADTGNRVGFEGTLKPFIFDRLAVNLREQGYTAQEVDAVLALSPPLLSDIPKRLAAVRAFAALPEAAALSAANKRVGNILKKSEAEINAAAPLDAALLKEPAEIALAEALARIAPAADALFETGDYSGSLTALAALREPVDAFFDAVMVNAEDPRLRANRLALLARLRGAMNRVADLSRLSV